jgi:hypothetical protein
MYTVVSGRLNVVKGLKRTNQNVSFERTRHLISLEIIPVRIYLARYQESQTLISSSLVPF